MNEQQKIVNKFYNQIANNLAKSIVLNQLCVFNYNRKDMRTIKCKCGEIMIGKKMIYITDYKCPKVKWYNYFRHSLNIAILVKKEMEIN